MKSIAIANQKGGVGKTITVQNLAAALSRTGKRVLVVDLDPQANLSMNAGLDLHTQRLSTFDVLVNNCPITTIIRHSDQGYDVAPSKPILARAEGEMKGKPGWVRQLRTSLNAVENVYDYCLFDTPPTIVFLTVNALVASNDGVIIPFLPAPNAVGACNSSSPAWRNCARRTRTYASSRACPIASRTGRWSGTSSTR